MHGQYDGDPVRLIADTLFGMPGVFRMRCVADGESLGSCGEEIFHFFLLRSPILIFSVMSCIVPAWHRDKEKGGGRKIYPAVSRMPFLGDGYVLRFEGERSQHQIRNAEKLWALGGGAGGDGEACAD